jgi:hypothetical protein
MSLTKLSLARESLALGSNIPAGDEKTANLFLQCSLSFPTMRVTFLRFLERYAFTRRTEINTMAIIAYQKHKKEQKKI